MSEWGTVTTWQFTCLDCDRNGITRQGGGPPVQLCPDCGGRLLVYAGGACPGHLLRQAQENYKERKHERELARNVPPVPPPGGAGSGGMQGLPELPMVREPWAATEDQHEGDP